MVGGEALHLGELLGVADQHRGNHVIALGFDKLRIERDERGAGGHVLLGLDVHGETFTTELNGVDTNVNQQLYPTVETQPHGVPGLLYREHGGVGGGENRIPAGLDSNTLAQLSVPLPRPLAGW